MKLKNVSPLGELDVPLLKRVIAAGEVFEVPADIGEALAAQPDVFEVVKEKGEVK